MPACPASLTQRCAKPPVFRPVTSWSLVTRMTCCTRGIQRKSRLCCCNATPMAPVASQSPWSATVGRYYDAHKTESICATIYILNLPHRTGTLFLQAAYPNTHPSVIERFSQVSELWCLGWSCTCCCICVGVPKVRHDVCWVLGGGVSTCR
jgi:hypothetical protein